MKKLKKILFILILLVNLLFTSSTNSYAEDVIYSDNLIPTMTNNTSPSGTAKASSFYEARNLQAYLAFDHNNAIYNCWASAVGTTTGWLEYNFSEEKCITKYTIEPRNSTLYKYQSPKDWTFEAWDENTSSWIILDTKTDIVTWEIGIRNEFSLDNTNSYKKYRINISSIVDESALESSQQLIVIGELEMMEKVATPTNLTANAGDSTVQLTWDILLNADSYNIKRSTIAGGEYEVINTITNVTTDATYSYIDTTVENDVSYYYVVTAIVSGKEGNPSNEVKVTPVAENSDTPDNPIGSNATIRITMDTCEIKEYDTSSKEMQFFLTWYDNRSEGTGKAYYTFEKENATGFLSRKEYIAYEKISSFEVMEYNE